MDLNIEELTNEFYLLQGNTLPEKRKHLNYYIKKIQANIKTENGLDLLTKSIRPRNQLERGFRVEILLQLRRNEQILDILKGVDPVLNGKIYKNWKFFSDVFANMDCHTFFNDITPYISYSCMMKIITRLSKVLASENLADEYFNALREKYSIYVARIIMPACSIGLIKSTTEGYRIILTNKELLIFAKKDKNFLKFYFSVLQNFDYEIRFSIIYKKVLQYIGRTDADLFWNLYDIYNFNIPNIEIHLGESVIDFLFAQDESKTTNREVCVNMFKPRRVYNVLSKRGKMDVLLANFCHGDEDEFYRIYVDNKDREFYSILMFLENMPKSNYFRYLNEAFKLKFGKDLLDYPKYFNEDILKAIPTPEREKILDTLVKENDALIYLYGIKKSVPLLKEILDKDVENPDPYLQQLYRSCNLSRDEDALLDVLKYINDKFRHREHLINEISMEIVQWSNADKLKPEIWKLIDEMVEVIEYSDEVFTSGGFNSYLHNHIINSVDNNIPFDKIFQEMLKRRTGNFLCFEENNVNVKRYCEEVRKLMVNMRKKDDFYDIVYYLLQSIFRFYYSKKKEDAISLLDYGHLLEMYAKREVYYDHDFITFGALKNIHSSFNDLCLKTYKYIYDYEGFAMYAQNQPEIFLKNTFLFDVKTVACMKKTYFDNYSTEMRRNLSDYCLDILTPNYVFNANNVVVAFKLLSLINEEEYLNVIRSAISRNLYQIHDPGRVMEKAILCCLRSSPKIADFLPLAVKVYKKTQIKHYLAPIHSYLHKIPLNQTKAIIKLFSENSIVRFRRLSVTLAYVFLTKSELHDWIRAMNEKETDRSVKRHLCKKAYYLFIQNQNETNWALLKENIDLVGNDSRSALELLSMVPLISTNYCEQYVTHSFSALSKNGDVGWYKKKMLKEISSPTHGRLSLAFLKSLLEEIPFHTTRTINIRYVIDLSVIPKSNYHIEFLFYTSGETQDSLLEFIFDKLKVYIDENWSDFPDAEVFSNVYEFMRAFCKYSFMLKPKDGIVKKFHEKWKTLFPTSYFQAKFLMLDFLNLYFESECEVNEFSKRCSQVLRTSVDLYGGVILEIYCSQLENFRDAASIDLFSFLFGLIEDKPDPLIYSAVARMLPSHYSIYYTDEPKLEELRSILRNCNEPAVNLCLSEYYSRGYW